MDSKKKKTKKKLKVHFSKGNRHRECGSNDKGAYIPMRLRRYTVYSIPSIRGISERRWCYPCSLQKEGLKRGQPRQDKPSRGERDGRKNAKATMYGIGVEY